MLTSQPQLNIWVTTLHYLGAPPPLHHHHSPTSYPLAPYCHLPSPTYLHYDIRSVPCHPHAVGTFFLILCYVTNIFLPTLPLIHNSLRGCRLCEAYVTIHIYALCYNVCVYVCVWVRVGVTDLVLWVHPSPSLPPLLLKSPIARQLLYIASSGFSALPLKSCQLWRQPVSEYISVCTCSLMNTTSRHCLLNDPWINVYQRCT